MRRRALLMGGSREESAFIPFLNNLRYDLSISTRNGNLKAIWGDGSFEDVIIPKNTDLTPSSSSLTVTTKLYDSPFTGDVELILKKGLKDVYSIALYKQLTGNNPADATIDKFNIFNLTDFLLQFPNLFSFRIALYGYGNASNQARAYGDLALVPDWIKKISVTSCDVTGFPETLYLDIDRYTSNSELEWFHQENSTAAGGNVNKLKIIGDIKNLPPNVNYFKVLAPHPTLATFHYTSGRDWRSDFDTLYINKVLTNTENDNILIDLANSVTSAIGDKIIYLRGARTSASDSAVLYLEGLGFTVTIVA